MPSLAEKQREMKEKVAKEAIYEAALKVISLNKNDGLKMQDIADAAGMATGTLYNYFENKENLLYYVDRRLHRTILEMMQRCADQRGPAMDRLENLTRTLLEFCEEHHVVFDLAEKFGIIDRIPRDEKNEGVGQAVSCIKKVLDSGIRQKVFKPVDTTASARLFLYALIGVMEVQYFVGEYDLPRFSRELLDSFCDYLEIQNS
ncbi:MAG: TetR/AcrR family transcriptional regulator [Planctomycetota bacterium]|jgi:AcrR family transcriptional regulator